MLIMEQVESHLEAPNVQRSRWRLRFSLVVAGAAILVFVLAAVDRAHVASHDALSNVAFGMPLNWLNQNQASLDPPLPHSARLLSPWEYPTDLSLGLLVIDLLVVLALLVGSRFLIRSITAASWLRLVLALTSPVAERSAAGRGIRVYLSRRLAVVKRCRDLLDAAPWRSS